jgi:hypothetical protein
MPPGVDLRPQFAAGLAVLAHNENLSLTRALFEHIDLER